MTSKPPPPPKVDPSDLIYVERPGSPLPLLVLAAIAIAAAALAGGWCG